MDIGLFIKIFFLIFVLSSCTSNFQTTSKKNMNCNNSNAIQLMTDSIINNTTSIGEQLWMSENLNVCTFRNGDSIHTAESITDWMNYCDKMTPALYKLKLSINDYYKILNVNNSKTSNDTLEFVLYNNYVITDDRNIAPYGWKIPRKKDWELLIRNVKSDRYLLRNDTQVESYGNPYKFNLSPMPLGFTKKGYDIFPSFSFLWSYPNELICIHTLFDNDLEFAYDDPEDFRWHTATKYTGCCVRCVKE